jgi:hypothetical protein
MELVIEEAASGASWNRYQTLIPSRVNFQAQYISAILAVLPTNDVVSSSHMKNRNW